jgi:ABC-type glycerol-3-phosphate transport system permease component
LSFLVVLPASLLTLFAIVMVVAVVALVAWALELMQAANDRREFSLMLAGCMVCSAAVGLATVMVLTLTGANRLEARGLLPPIPQLESGVSLDAIVLPRQGPPQSRPGSPE